MDNNHALLPDLRVFACVVEQGSFTLAARLLNTSTAATSRSVRKLEDAVGVQLLNRTTRRVGTTDMGAELYARCRSGLRQLDQAITEVRNSRTEARGLMRVTSSLSFGHRFVAPAVIDFRMLHPDIEIELSLTDDVLDLVESGFDIAVRGGLPNDARLIARKLAPLPMYVCASPAFLKRNPAPRRPQDLRGAQCIRFRLRGANQPFAWEFMDGSGQRFAVEVQGPLGLDDIEAVCDAAVAGLGFAQLPGYVAVQPIRDGKLVPLLLGDLDASRLFAVTYLNRSDMQPLRDTLFVKHLGTRLADPQPFLLSAKELRAFSPRK
ncbi:LysR family transcriptional regulator [Ramlibacter sp.]|uniref:LysR family transcriptional regulator n=1 Tax=Ramlibacter sp. TaxID=1917967 RepID=UPI001813DB30|nr:LysR family transcriptional regulator [Ramlibacter sp.]MBA2676543.1 LysR family transcriptional regulator [Ramlibacter sp.]